MEKGLKKDFTSLSEIVPDKEMIFTELKNFHVLMTTYNCAIREVKTKFEVLNDELSTQQNSNPIEMIKSRIKTPQSIFKKLKKYNLDISSENITNYINDVAGIRIICSFVDDIYKVADMFVRQDDVKVLQIKDYIKNPKENGYRSYHMIVEIPVFFSNCKQNVKVEVQLRTIAMDFWASLEHQMKYKKDNINSVDVIKRLKECADVISKTDYEMQNINKEIIKMK